MPALERTSEARPVPAVPPSPKDNDVLI